MSPLAAIVLAGVGSYLLRSVFLVLVPARSLPEGIARALAPCGTVLLAAMAAVHVLDRSASGGPALLTRSLAIGAGFVVAVRGGRTTACIGAGMAVVLVGALLASW
jgi:branched-subunit amino acid transport protein